MIQLRKKKKKGHCQGNGKPRTASGVSFVWKEQCFCSQPDGFSPLCLPSSVMWKIKPIHGVIVLQCPAQRVWLHWSGKDFFKVLFVLTYFMARNRNLFIQQKKKNKKIYLTKVLWNQYDVLGLFLLTKRMRSSLNSLFALDVISRRRCGTKCRRRAGTGFPSNKDS